LGLVGGIGRRAARRSKWLARRMWIVGLAEVALLTRWH
jgi:hypothetical protein